ncbi:MAG: hypothetical protein ABIG71_00915 [Candidatus Uhrbacteria bacterium]
MRPFVPLRVDASSVCYVCSRFDVGAVALSPPIRTGDHDGIAPTRRRCLFGLLRGAFVILACAIIIAACDPCVERVFEPFEPIFTNQCFLLNQTVYAYGEANDRNDRDCERWATFHARFNLAECVRQLVLQGVITYPPAKTFTVRVDEAIVIFHDTDDLTDRARSQSLRVPVTRYTGDPGLLTGRAWVKLDLVAAKVATRNP